MRAFMIVVAGLMLWGGVSAAELPKIVAVGLGAKNPTLDESKFPNIQFCYTPGLVSKAQGGKAVKAMAALAGGAREVLSGEPSFLSEWYDKKDIHGAFILLDKNGVVASQGYDLLRQGEILKRKDIENTPLKKVFKKYVKKEKTRKLKANKKITFKKNDCLMNTQCPAFDVQVRAGEEKSLTDIASDGTPTMIVFFRLAEDLDIGAAKKTQKKQSTKGFFGALAQSGGGEKSIQELVQIEEQLFGTEVDLDN